MNKALGLSPEIFGIGGGIFFAGYFLFEIPGNLIQSKVGARRWIARILITWGVISGLTAFVTGTGSFSIGLLGCWRSRWGRWSPASYWWRSSATSGRRNNGINPSGSPPNRKISDPNTLSVYQLLTFYR